MAIRSVLSQLLHLGEAGGDGAFVLLLCIERASHFANSFKKSLESPGSREYVSDQEKPHDGHGMNSFVVAQPLGGCRQ